MPTSLVGSYAQPDWLIDRQTLAGRLPAARAGPRVVAGRAENFSTEAQDDATLLAIRDQERAGLDIITDGEQRRESYSNRFATALEGVDIDNPGTALDRSGHSNPVPRVAGKVRRKYPVEVREQRLSMRCSGGLSQSFTASSTLAVSALSAAIAIARRPPAVMSRQLHGPFRKSAHRLLRRLLRRVPGAVPRPRQCRDFHLLQAQFCLPSAT